jgi:hypothetical protein
MAQHHNYSISDLENLMPYELELYMSMVIDFIDKQKEQQQMAQR